MLVLDKIKSILNTRYPKIVKQLNNNTSFNGDINFINKYFAFLMI